MLLLLLLLLSGDSWDEAPRKGISLASAATASMERDFLGAIGWAGKAGDAVKHETRAEPGQC